jgi:ABC-type amino acid transport substrate-binding protein
LLKENGTIKLLTDYYILGKNVKLPEIAASSGEEVMRLVVPSGEFPPYCMTDETGEYDGLDVLLARYICASLGVTLEIVPLPVYQIIDEVRFGKADFAMGGLYVTEENSELVKFSDPYGTIEMSVITRK